MALSRPPTVEVDLMTFLRCWLTDTGTLINYIIGILLARQEALIKGIFFTRLINFVKRL